MAKNLSNCIANQMCAWMHLAIKTQNSCRELVTGEATTIFWVLY